MEDLFEKEQLPYVAYAIRYCLKRQKKTYITNDPKPIENFYFDKRGLHFLYNRYTIASGVDGAIDVCIPWLFPNASWQPKNEKEALYGRIFTTQDLSAGIVNTPEGAIRLKNQKALCDLLEWTDVKTADAK